MQVLFTSLTIQLKYFVENMVIVLLIIAAYRLRIYGKTGYISTTQVNVFYLTITL